MSEPTTTSSISVAVTNSVSGTYINRNVKPFDPTQPHQTPAMTAFNTSLDKFRSNPKFVVKEITPIAVSPFGPLGKAKAGFGYVHANVQYSKIKNPTTGAPVTVPGLALVRGGSVTILTFLHCNGIDYVILTEQPRIPIGEPEYLEAPAGMQDGNNNFIGVAANEMGQEVGLTNLGSTDFKYLCKFFPSAGGTDESMIELFMRVKCDKTVLDYLNGHLAGAIEENEQITVRIRPLSLNAVYDRQVLNIEQRNVLNWPEYPTYGYFVGGASVNSPSQSSTITRLDLATNVGSLPGKNLPTARIDLVSVSNNFYGYIAGGILNTLVRLDFANETSSIPGKNFTQNSRSSQAAVSNLLYGYFGGGYAPGLSSIISRLEFSSETVSNPNINFSPSRAKFAAVSSSTYGYFGGGYTPTLRSTITRLDFSTENLSAPGKNLPTGIGEHAGLSNISYGYFGGGNGVCTINRLDFSNETVSAPGKNLPSVRRGPLVFSDSPATGSLNGSYGYFGGGGVPTGSGITDIIQQLDFATENINTSSATLGQQVRNGAAVANSGSSLRIV